MSDFKCDPQTRLELDASPNKLQDAAVIQAALGNTGRRVIMKRDANPNAADPWATGVVFRNVGASGALKIVAGKIKNLGKLKGTTVQLAADTSTGKTVLRMQSANGSRWIQGSVGPNGDFEATAPFTATNGLSVRADFAISGKRLKPSGVGPAAPDALNDPEAPYSFELFDWTVPGNPLSKGLIAFDTRADDFTYEDREIAEENGDVAIVQSSKSILFGEIEFGFTLIGSHKGNTVDGLKPLYQVLGSQAHRGTWTSYPFSDTFDASQHVTYPDPYKIVMKNRAGNVLHIFEMHDGLPINSPELAQHQTDTTPLRPHTNCAQQLGWQNTKPKISSKANKWFSGINDVYDRPSVAKTHYSFIAVEPLITGGYSNNSRNGLHTPWSVDRWPRPDVDFWPAVADPYMANQNSVWPPHAQTVDGYDYEPGSFSTHNWYTGPGGPRHDRSAIATTLAWWISDPNRIRLQDNVPARDLADGFIMGYLNHSNKWVTDPKTLKFIDNSRILGGKVSNGDAYYGDYTMAPENKISTRANMREGENAYHYDRTGRLFYSGWGRDPLHSYANAGWAALLQTNPMMGIVSKWDTTTQFMIHGEPGWSGRSDYMVRTQAWDWLHYTIAWKLASTHPLGFSRAEIEEAFMVRLEAVWRDVYKPTFIDNDPGIYYEGIRRFGFPLEDKDGWALGNPGGQLAFYFTNVLMLMKQTGLWSVLMAKGGHIKDVLLMHIANMDRHCFGVLTKTKWSRATWRGYDNGVENQNGGYLYFPYNQALPASFEEYSALNESQLSDFMHDDNGGFRGHERDVSDHPFMAYPAMRKNFFPEIPHPLLDASIAKVNSYHDMQTAWVAEATNPADKRSRDYIWGYAGVATIKAPIELGEAG